MVHDLNVPVAIVPVATVREADGLALSSRNKHLTPAQRAIAPVLSQALRQSVDMIREGERSVAAIKENGPGLYLQNGREARVEYFEPDRSKTLVTAGTCRWHQA